MSDSIKIRRNIKDSDAIYFVALLMKKYCPNGIAEFSNEFSEELPEHATVSLLVHEDGCIITYLEDGDNEESN